MTLDNLMLLNSILFFIVYIIRYKDELLKRLIILVIGSVVVYIFIYFMFLKASLTIYSISKSILLFVLLDQLHFTPLDIRTEIISNLHI